MIYVDCDGVLADFDAGLEELYGIRGIPDPQTFWEHDVKANRFYLHLPPIREGLKLLELLRSGTEDVCILTSTGGGTHHMDIAQQKLEWLQEHGVRDLPVAFPVNTKSKATFAHSGRALIDDRAKVCDAWVRKRGDAILFEREIAPVLVQLRSWGYQV